MTQRPPAAPTRAAQEPAAAAVVHGDARAGAARGVALAVVALAVLVLAACAAGPNTAAAQAPQAPGFWLGLWHGFISPVTFLVSLFRDDVNLYEVHNSGNWYNLGFMIGIGAVLGGGARSRR